MSPPLRVGFVVDGLAVPAWQAELIRAVDSEPGLKCVLLLVSGARSPSLPHRPLLAAYHAFDRFLDRGRNTLLETVALPPGGTSVVECIPDHEREGSRLDPDTAERIREHRLDVLVRLGAGQLAPEDPAVARSGTWRIRFDDGDLDCGEGPGLREMAEDRPVVGATLEVCAADGTHAILDRTTCATHPHSLLRTRCVLFAAVVSLTLGRLRSLRDLGPGFLARPRGGPESFGASGSPPLSDLSLLAFLSRCVVRVVHRLASMVLRDEFHWTVAIAVRPVGSGFEAMRHAASFRRFSQPADLFLADPFLFEHQGQHFLFMERFSYATGRGTIAVSRVGPGAELSSPEVVLERPYHLSYPCVFSWRGQVFMIPETGGQRTIELYRCERFPDVWVLDSILMEGIESADATVLQHEGRLWMFVSLATRGMSADTELCVFHAEDVRGPWRPHPLNPVVSDVRRARPAGGMWWEGDQLIRPAQDCARHYGSAISFQRITTLTPENYAEEPMARLAPDQLGWKRMANGMHTWNLDSRFVVTDTTTSRFRVARWFGARAEAARMETKSAAGDVTTASGG